MRIKYITICLIMLCCFVGAVSATEDVTTDDVVAASDDVAVDEVVSEVDTSDESTITENDEVLAINVNDEDSDLSISNSNKFFVNGSKDYDDSLDGQTWETALGDSRGIYYASSFVNENGIIYVTGKFTQFNIGNNFINNITYIGFDRENTIVQVWDLGNKEDSDHYKTTFINMTFVNSGQLHGNDLTFINCTFINFKTEDPINPNIDEQAEYFYGGIAPEESFVTNFINCDFINSTIDGGNLIDIDKYTQINFNNCNFANIIADSIVNSVKGKFHTQDSINFKECSFKNITTKGIVSIPTGKEISELVHIEGCTYDVLVSNDVITDGGRDYINTTASRVESVLLANVNDAENLVISLKGADDKVIDGAEILISVNGEEAIPYGLEDDGTFTIAVSDLTTETGAITITVEFKENNDYKGNLTTVPYVIRNATSIAANNVTATEGEAKNITATLKDNNGNPIAGKTITVSVNGQNSTVTTGSNGVANIPVNVDKAGVSEYTLFFAGDETTYKNSTLVVKVNVTEASSQPESGNTTPVNPGKTDTTTPTKKINPVATKITAKKATFKAKKKTKKYTITLKAGKKAVKKVKVTIKVGKKTYTAKTNAKGKATFNLKKLTKKGKYTAIIKFKGNKNYKATTKKVKITVKK